MALNTREKRASVLGVARPWMRDKLPTLDLDQAWRMASGNTYVIATLQIITLLGGIASAEAFETDATIQASAVQSISDVGGIATAEAFEIDNQVALSAVQVISDTGAIATGEAFENDHQIELASGPVISERLVKFSMRMGFRM